MALGPVLPRELWESVFALIQHPEAFAKTCRLFRAIAASTTARMMWLRVHHSHSLLSDSAFDILDSAELLAFETLAKLPQNRLFRILCDANLLLRIVSEADFDDPKGLYAGGIGRRRRGAAKQRALQHDVDQVEQAEISHASRCARRLLRFICWRGNAAALNEVLENSVDISFNRRELAIAAAFAINSNSMDCLLPILLRNPALSAQEHLAFCEAIRTDNLLAAQLLQDLYKRQQVGSASAADALNLTAALKKAMLWVGKPLTLHYMLKNGASIFFFDWNYFASMMETDGVASVYSDVLTVLIHHVSAGRLDLSDFCDEGFVAGCRWNDISFLNSLVSLGLKPENDGDDAMVAAASWGNEAAVKWLLKHGVCASDRALVAAARDDHEEVIKLLLEAGADVAGEHGKFESLVDACARGSLSTVRALAVVAGKAGREVAMRVAVWGNDADVVRVLCDVEDAAGVQVGDSDKGTGGTQLVWRALNVRPHVSEFITRRLVAEAVTISASSTVVEVQDESSRAANAESISWVESRLFCRI